MIYTKIYPHYLTQLNCSTSIQRMKTIGISHEHLILLPFESALIQSWSLLVPIVF